MTKVKGMRDYFPEYQSRLNALIRIIEETYASYGYVPLDSPAMEELAILVKKSGPDIEKQIFKVEGKYGLRFDLTVPLARIAATNQFAMPFKRYCIGKVWRLEEPQKGRFREFYQADIDIIGVKSMRAEAELLACASRCLEKLGIKFSIMVNHRQFISKALEKFGFSKIEEALRTLDKIDKIGMKKVKDELKMLGDSEGFIAFISQAIDMQSKLETIKKIDNTAYTQILELKELADTYNVSFDIDFSLVRGLGYYTGMVFEIMAEGFGSSVAGGGRYDNLVGMYGRGACAVGISLGIARLMEIVDFSKFNICGTQAYIITDDETYKEGIKLAEKLRNEGLRIEIDLIGRNIERQLAEADKKAIPYCIIYCSEEKRKAKAKLKDMKTKTQKEIAIEDLGKALKLLC